MTNHAHTTTTELISSVYVQYMTRHGDVSVMQVKNGFDRWHASELAAAEQRGAVKALKESANEVRREMRWQYEQNINRNSDTGDSIDRLLELEKVFKYRAAQMEAE